MRKILDHVSWVEAVMICAVAFLIAFLSLTGKTVYLNIFQANNGWLLVFFGLIVTPLILSFRESLKGTLKAQIIFESLAPILRSIFLFYLLIIFHFNLKMNVSLINGTLFDDFFVATDHWFSWYIGGVDALRLWLRSLAGSRLDYLYLFGYLSMFVVTFVYLHGWRRHGVARIVLEATLLTSLIGTLAYLAFPALGPFVFIEGGREPNMSLWREVVSTGTASREYFFAALAAMPSLHAAHAVTFTLAAGRYFPALLWFFVPMTGWIFIDAVFLRWHYVLDLIAGALIGIVGWYLVTKFRAGTDGAQNLM